MKMMQASILCFLLVIPACLALPHYQARIPNGDKVPHPCKGNQNWPGVGHEQQFGEGTRNVFGKAFEKENRTWTQKLCKEDSDGDGITNGDELGDPHCVWKEGQTPHRTDLITHPGICNPFDKTECKVKNSFVSCELNSFEKCKADITNEKGLLNMSLTFKEYRVPAGETTYVCQIFDLPDDKEYHIVANEAIIDQVNVLHHMLLYGCKENSLTESAPTECNMFESSCQSIIGVWSLGLQGECFGNSVGFRIGSNSYKRVRLQMHYNNVEKKSTYVDSSGLRLYYRPAKTTVQDLFTLTTGQIMLDLPPGQSRIVKDGICKSSCTSRALQNTIYVFSALNHMHYLGRSMIIQLVRGGKVIINLTNDEKFSYDSPVTHYHNSSIKIEPGDEIITRCIYNTSTSKDHVYFGDATSDEMCFGFIRVYPKQKHESIYCLAQSILSSCEPKDCDVGDFLHFGSKVKEMATDLHKNCGGKGRNSSECKASVEKHSKDKCFQCETGKYVKAQMARTAEGSKIFEYLGLSQLHDYCPKGGATSFHPLSEFTVMSLFVTFVTLIVS